MSRVYPTLYKSGHKEVSGTDIKSVGRGLAFRKLKLLSGRGKRPFSEGSATIRVHTFVKNDGDPFLSPISQVTSIKTWTTLLSVNWFLMLQTKENLFESFATKNVVLHRGSERTSKERKERKECVHCRTTANAFYIKILIRRFLRSINRSSAILHGSLTKIDRNDGHISQYTSPALTRYALWRRLHNREHHTPYTFIEGFFTRDFAHT